MSHKQSNLVNIGRITTVFGVKGWLKVHSSTEPAEKILDYNPWWLKTRHGVKKVEIDEGRPHGNDTFAVHIKGVDDRELAREYCQIDIAIEHSQMDELPEGEFYWHELEGLVVLSSFTDNLIRLGTVDRLLETGANDVLVVKGDVDSLDEQQRLIPYVPGQFVKSVDTVAGQIVVDWDPEF